MFTAGNSVLLYFKSGTLENKNCLTCIQNFFLFFFKFFYKIVDMSNFDFLIDVNITF
jgi:hypothetical protein